LEAALFEVPAGYTQASSQQEMYGAPSMAEIMAMAQQQSGQNPGAGNQNSMPSSKQSSTSSTLSSMTAQGNNNAPAKTKVGIVEFNNKTKTSVSTDELRERLVATLNGNGLDAVALNASSPSEAAMEAQAKGCTYILYTDISTLKAASSGKKIGGMFGRVTGV